MEVGNGYGKDRNAVVVYITLVLCDARCTNRWESSKPDVVRVVVAVECYQSMFQSDSIYGKGERVVGQWYNLI